MGDAGDWAPPLTKGGTDVKLTGTGYENNIASALVWANYSLLIIIALLIILIIIQRRGK